MIVSLIKQIPEMRNYRMIAPINKGLSSDKKYLIYMANSNDKLLLRTFNPEQFEVKKCEYFILEQMLVLGVVCPKPIAIGQTEKVGYMIVTYIEGNDGENEILTVSKEEQFSIGYRAGVELRKMHQLAAPEHISSWYTRKVAKHNRYVEAYLSCGVKVKNDEKIIGFIDANLHLMKQRPNVFQHDDFHLSNLIFHDKQFAGVIDFERHDWGDPIHEFLKIGIFSRGISTKFSTGQIKGYFNGAEPDEEFWRLYSLYLAMCVFSSVVWTLNTFPEDIDNALDKIYLFLDDHDYFSQWKPKWYT
ncbi:aminoglycoside phosphotransferase family protein [Planococcus soli]|uniref:aminoglycoside phosphotransferase family protein n=1 Tax=Planococcus soli TaxID=2666072 RepID=UPI00115DEF5D|nr:aminoglycoside phosphotransferase family protein [Planococcus soli]